MTAIRNTLAALALGAATLTGAAAVHAQTTAPAPGQPAATAPANATLTVHQIYDTLTAAGYRNITEIELEHGRYDVKVDNAQGQRVKLRVDAQSGAVLRSRIKD
ncbi:PepSY domain-containing protein [Achromobacter aegrifaciens]|uniref:PepSY domain-containing protein n=1 Tax=Achromobacter aegrifaciens TaxID=1287736 RepID=UPI00278EB921|nr:PepSY domain-containing protein [Achromobacter aegrifaciens]MDQ1762200.1 PepSY domain-containing protein [Achromobacter aegrifaciens]